MPRFIALHPFSPTEEQLISLAKERPPEGVTWHDTFCAVAENKSYCHWEAPSQEHLVEIFKKYEIPCEAIHAVRRFDPVAGVMEPAPAEMKAPQPV